MVAISFPANNSVEPIVTTTVLELSPVYAPRLDNLDDIEWDIASFESAADKCPCAEALWVGVNPIHSVFFRNHHTIRAPPEWTRLT